MKKPLFDYNSNLQQWYLKDKFTVKEIADRCGCKTRNVYRHLRKQGIPLGGGKRYHEKIIKKYEPFKEQVSLLLSQRVSPYQIAEIAGLTESKVRTIIKLFGLKTNPLTVYTGEKSSNWKGGYKTYHGYIRKRVPNHPYVASDGYVPLHRIIMEKKLERYLLPSEHVHHIDGDRSNNDINNLELLSPQSHFMKTKLCFKCPLRQEIKRLKKQLIQAQYSCQLILGNIAK